MKRGRAIIVALGALTAIAAAWFLRQHGPGGWWPGCVFKKFTGLYCPGCGMTRATIIAMHGHLGTAMRFNPLGMILLPVALVGIGAELLAWVRDKPQSWRLHLGRHAGWIITLTVLVFWILRNLPWWPCTLLAPH